LYFQLPLICQKKLSSAGIGTIPFVKGGCRVSSGQSLHLSG